MNIRTIMNSSPLTVQVDDDLGLASQMLVWAGIHHLIVVDEGKLAGILTDRDVAARQAQIGEAAARQEPVRAAMESSPQTATPEDTVIETAGRMAVDRLSCLPVVEDGELVGLVTTTDILAAQVRTSLEPAPAAGPSVSEVMTRDPVTAHPDDYLLDAAAKMQSHKIRHLPVVDGEDTVVGMLSDRDVRTAVGNPAQALDPATPSRRIRELRVEGAMSRAVVVARADSSSAEVASAFADTSVSAVPVVDDRDKIIGVLSYIDLLRALGASQASSEQHP